MSKEIGKTVNKNSYPSAELVLDVCREDYKHQIDTYDKIYGKVNIALGFSGVIFLVIVSSFDYTIINRINGNRSTLELFSLLTYLLCSIISSVLITWTVIQLLLLMKGKELPVISSVDIHDNELYRVQVKDSAVWLIDKYTMAISSLRPIIREKQRKYNATILKIVISLLCYAIVLIIQKGL